jgi:membrane protease YdiL (CAAX protease family)
MLGALMGYAYYFSTSLILPMLLHCLNNSFATLSLYLMGGKLDSTDIEKADDIPLVFVITFTFAFGLVWYQILRVKNQSPFSSY